ncbi:MAG: DNA-binding protein, partial [Candidatus Omnitrophica bacterium]|nr:DNA-binding protein [Candidatus Omnitrophota bacterium]
AHIMLADWEGRCYGGHLMPGTMIFAAEYCIKELTGLELHRGHDQETGLSLWI